MTYEIQSTSTKNGKPRFRVRLVDDRGRARLLTTATGKVRLFANRELAERGALCEMGAAADHG